VDFLKKEWPVEEGFRETGIILLPPDVDTIGLDADSVGESGVSLMASSDKSIELIGSVCSSPSRSVAASVSLTSFSEPESGRSLRLSTVGL